MARVLDEREPIGVGSSVDLVGRLGVEGGRQRAYALVVAQAAQCHLSSGKSTTERVSR